MDKLNNNFHEWFDSIKKPILFTSEMKELMQDAWDAAIAGIPLVVTIGEDVTRNDIILLKKNIEDAKAIPCTCDEFAIKDGMPCVCIRSGALLQSIVNLSKYIKELK